MAWGFIGVFTCIDGEECFFTLLKYLAIFALVIPSMVHYSLSIRRWPYTWSLWGIMRFITDIVILMLYISLGVFIESLDIVIKLIVAIFGVYIIWDLFRYVEYRHLGDVSFLKTRIAVNAVFFLILTFLYYANVLVAYNMGIQGFKWYTLALITMIILMYRAEKNAYLSTKEARRKITG